MNIPMMSTPSAGSHDALSATSDPLGGAGGAGRGGGGDGRFATSFAGADGRVATSGTGRVATSEVDRSATSGSAVPT